MNNLKPLKSCTHHEFDVIHKIKQAPTKTRLTEIRSDIRIRFNEYLENFWVKELKNISPINYVSPYKNALLHCYNSSVDALDDLKVRIRNNQPDLIKTVCQYCGIETDHTFDHYLPKEIFPEYSINHLNLIPYCWRCNQLKSVIFLDGLTKNRSIINMYTDVIPNVQFLFVKITLTVNNIPYGAYEIKNEEKLIEPGKWQIIKSHFKELELIDRYNEKFSNTYRTIYNSIKPNIISGIPLSVLRKLLYMQIESDIEDFGINNFKTVVKKKIADDEDLIEQIIMHTLNTKI